MASIEQLERKILELQNKLKEQTEEMAVLMEKSRKAIDLALHAYRLDAYGFLWQWDVEEQKYRRTKMRVATPEIIDKAIHTHHLADGAVTGEKIVDEAVTGDKIGSSGVIAGKIANDAVSTRNIQVKAITREKLSDELWAEICDTVADELLVARYGETTYAEAVYYFEKGKMLIGFAEGLYYNMVGYDLTTFTFTQVDEKGVLHTIKLSADGWSDEISHEEMAMGNVAMEFVDMDEELLEGEETEEVNN